MSKIVESKTKASGNKRVTSTLLDTPFGTMQVQISVGGYKSSEGDQVFDPPADIDELESAEESTGESE